MPENGQAIVEGWKNIGHFLGAGSLKTAQRWCKLEKNLIHHRPDRSVWAYADELKAFIARRLDPRRDSRTVAEESVIRFTMPVPGTDPYAEGVVRVSTDGRIVVYASNRGNAPLFVRTLDSIQPRALPGTEGARQPFLDPKGEWCGFFAREDLRKVRLTGGPTQTLCSAEEPRGGAWSRNGVIIFSAENGNLFQISDRGGSLRPLKKAENEVRRFPEFIDDTRYLFMLSSNSDPSRSGIYLGTLSGEERLVSSEHSNAAYVPDEKRLGGYLLFVNVKGKLIAHRFDPNGENEVGNSEDKSIQLSEEAIASTGYTSGYCFSASPGTLLYRSDEARRALTWVDRKGNQVGDYSEPLAIRTASPISLSPDGSKVLLTLGSSEQCDIWSHRTSPRFPSHKCVAAVEGTAWHPVWHPGGKRILFSAWPRGTIEGKLKARRLDRVENAVDLSAGIKMNLAPLDWSSDGRLILYRRSAPKQELWLFTVGRDQRSQSRLDECVRFLNSSDDLRAGRFSPDGKWIAYSSNQPVTSHQRGAYHMYVRLTSGSAEFTRISDSAGGDQPCWRSDGKELFFLGDGKVVATAITGAQRNRLDFSRPEVLFENADVTSFAPSPDGNRFLIHVPAPGVPPPALIATLSWQILFS